MPRGTPTDMTPGAYANVSRGQRMVASSNTTGSTFFSGLDLESTVPRGAINFTSGLIHIIDGSLTIPLNASTTPVDLGFSARAGAATQAGLVTVLDEAKAITVFASNNAAFAAIGLALQNVSSSAVNLSPLIPRK